MFRFWAELSRRKVTRVAVAYIIVGWAIIEVADTVLPHLQLEWSIPVVIVLVILGFPLCLVIAWGYDITPGGVKRTPALSADWHRVQEILGAAFELPPAQRRAWIRSACGDDDVLLREIQSLLDAHDRAGPLDAPAPALQRLSVESRDAPPSLARSAPHYEILDRVGGGGMGVVYRARDRRLERTVALKFLPPHMTRDHQAMERFLVEAQAAAALDHPNICTIYEVGETDEAQLFIAMPYYEGETLKHRLERGRLEIDEALDIARQVASGLARAHERGIVHRDIKPANLMLAGEGIVKIVDFGVAKLASMDVTRPGMALGTVAYMSPEQAQGDDVDGRTDIWSLGVVLYEMLAGERPFRGDHDRIVLNSITSAEPARLSALRSDLPAAVEDVVLRALAKRRADRYATARELLAALAAATTRSHAVAASHPHPTNAHVAPRTSSDATVTGEASGGLMAEGERRQVTIAVCRVADYSELVERLAPDQLNRVLARLQATAESIVVSHGGLLNQFDGEQLVLLFGVPTAQEDDAIRATRAALELHTQLARADEAADAPALHTGVDTGIVVSQATEGGDRAWRVTGFAPQTAARLAEHAAAGEIWLSTECRNLVAPFFELEAQQELSLRGGRQQIVPYRVLGESGLSTRFEAAERTGLTEFTGRDLEVGTLRRCLAEVVAGEGSMVAITGDAGLGKSRLLYEFRRHVLDADAVMLVGRCQSYGGGVAYLPFIDVLRTGLDLRSDDDVEVTAARIRAISARLEEFIPLYLHLLSIRSTTYPVPRHLHGDAFRLAMQEALAAIITLYAQQQRCVVVLEDWHWADDASQAVLRQIAEVIAAYPLFVVVTARPGYGVDPGGTGQITHIPLKPLEPAATGAMLRSVLHVEQPPDALIALIHERTAGNPFYIEEICHALLEAGAIRRADGGAVTDEAQLMELPDSVQGVIRARLDRLDREVRDVLRVAAVIGREFPRSILERALHDLQSLPRALDTLKSTGLIQQTQVAPDAGYRFKHVLTHEVAYASLLEHQRRDLHGRVGDIIEQLDGDRTDDQLERLAHHFSRAEYWPRAVHYGLRSADRANRLAQYPEALQILERTQRWVARLAAGPERDTSLADILLQQERLCETLGQRTRQQQIIDQLIALLSNANDRTRLAEVYLRQGDLNTLLRRFAEAEAALHSSLALRRELGDRVGERNTLRSLGLLRWHEERNEEALQIAEETLRIDRERNDLPAIVGDLTNCGAILRALGHLDRAREFLEEALEIGDEHRNSEAEHFDPDELAIKRVYALQHLANIYREQGERELGIECLQRAGRIAEEKRLPIQLAYHYTSLAHVHLQEGRVEESLKYYRDSIELSRRARHASGLANSLRILGEVLIGFDRSGESTAHLTEAAALFAELRDVENEAKCWSAVAAAEEKLGNAAAALTAWGRAAQLFRQLRDARGEMIALEGLGRTTRLHIGEASLALSHYHGAAALAEATGDARTEGRLRNAMGILEWSRGDFAAALSHYQRALHLFQSLDDAASAALMLNSIAATLRAMGRSGDAAQQLTTALEIQRRIGSKQLEGHALALLADICLDMDQADSAAEHYAASLAIRQLLGDRRGEGWMLHGLARCELARGFPYQVREYAAAAARIAGECGDAELATACEQLRRVAD
jgi:class 3 adenylate cyclase/tetratricopeptide (TPR) repeat protein